MCGFVSLQGFPGDLVKNLAANAGDVSLNPGVGRSPGEGKWQPTPVFLPGKSHGQRSLVGYSPWGCRVDRTWRLNKYTEACFKG